MTLLLGLGACRAWAGLPAVATDSEDQAMGRRLQEELRAHGADIHGCYGVALAEKAGLRGELLVRLHVTPDGAVTRAEVLKDEIGSGRLASCLGDAMRRWKVPHLGGKEPQQVVFPLAFTPEDPPAATRAVVRRADGEPGPLSGGKLEARVLIDEKTVGATQASLTVLTLKPSTRLALHQHPHARELVFVLKGRAHLRDAQGLATPLGQGEARDFAAGEGHSIEAAPLASLELVQIFVPGGPERAYRDPSARADTVPARKTRGAPGAGRSPAAPASYSILGAKGRATLLLDGVSPQASLQLIEAAAAAKIAPHQHDESDEILFVIAGKGRMTIGGRPQAIAAGDAVHIPKAVPHSLDVDEKLTAVQCYAPGGPEQRFKPRATPR